jgi:hypothetical protein
VKIRNKKKWTREEDSKLIYLAQRFHERHWKEISKHFSNKNSLQCFSRYKRIKPGIIKGAWTQEEDNLILELVQTYGKVWSKISKMMKSRNGKQIRDRFINILDPEIKKGKFTDEEDDKLIKLYMKNGPRWAYISNFFPNRTADMIKNRFHSSIKKNYFSQIQNIEKQFANISNGKEIKTARKVVDNKSFGKQMYDEEFISEISQKNSTDYNSNTSLSIRSSPQYNSSNSDNIKFDYYSSNNEELLIKNESDNFFNDDELFNFNNNNYNNKLNNEFDYFYNQNAIENDFTHGFFNSEEFFSS